MFYCRNCCKDFTLAQVLWGFYKCPTCGQSTEMRAVCPECKMPFPEWVRSEACLRKIWSVLWCLFLADLFTAWKRNALYGQDRAGKMDIGIVEYLAYLSEVWGMSVGKRIVPKIKICRKCRDKLRGSTDTMTILNMAMAEILHIIQIVPKNQCERCNKVKSQ